MKTKIVYIAHPVSGAVKKNLKLVAFICKKIHNVNIIPIAPYLGTLQYLDNNIFFDMSLGIGVNQLFFEKKFMDEVWLYGDRISTGMRQEIILAHQYKIPVIAKTKETKAEYKNLLKTL